MVTVGNYELGKALGKGTYGCVFEGIERVSQTKRAIKKINFSIKYEGVFLFFREISILRSIQHPGIIELKDVFFETFSSSSSSSQCVYLVTDLFECDLRCFVKREYANRKVPICTVRSWLFQICSALQYLHARGIMHRDLKPQNILIAADGTLRIADFGLAKMKRLVTTRKCAKVILTHEIVTLWYRAPEIILGASQYDEAIDMWSVGVILAEFVAGTNPFNGRNEVDTLMKIFRLIGTPSFAGVGALPNFSKKFPRWPGEGSVARWRKFLGEEDNFVDQLVDGLVQTDPSKRLSAAQVLNHAFIL